MERERQTEKGSKRNREGETKLAAAKKWQMSTNGHREKERKRERE